MGGENILYSSATQTKSTEGRFTININGIGMVSATQYATWVYQGAASIYPACPVYRTEIGRTLAADGTCTCSLGSAGFYNTLNGSYRFGIINGDFNWE